MFEVVFWYEKVAETLILDTWDNKLLFLYVLTFLVYVNYFEKVIFFCVETKNMKGSNDQEW